MLSKAVLESVGSGKAARSSGGFSCTACTAGIFSWLGRLTGCSEGAWASGGVWIVSVGGGGG